jgi:hypothetical protein
MESLWCMCVKISPLNFRMPQLILMKVDIYIYIYIYICHGVWTYLKCVFYKSLSSYMNLYVYPTSLLDIGSVKFTAATNTHAKL